jgi:hypothetical protein
MGAEGLHRYNLIWRVRTRLPERFGQRCRVLIRGGRNSALVEFEDGYQVITSRNYMRKAMEDPCKK